MDAAALEVLIVERIQDAGFSGSISSLIDKGRGEIAGEVDLPALHTVVAVTTSASAATVALPTSYSKGLYWVGSTVQRKRIGSGKNDYYNLLRFLEKHPIQDQVGLITDVVIQGSSLLYQGMAADSLVLRFYTAPTALTTGASIPSELPAHLHAGLLVNYVCREIYSIIEDPMEGGTPNTSKYNGLYQKALASLAEWAAVYAPREPKYTRDSNA